MLGKGKRILGSGANPRLMRERRLDDGNDNPMEMMGNLFDVAILIGIGFMIMALSGFGLREFLDTGDVTIVKNPGQPDMEIITKKNGKIERLKTTSEQAQGTGQAVGTVYRLEDGRMVWVPDDGTGTTTPPPGAVPVTPDPNAVPGSIDPNAVPVTPDPNAVPVTPPTTPTTTTP